MPVIAMVHAERSAAGYLTVDGIAAFVPITVSARWQDVTKRQSSLAGGWINERMALKTGQRGNAAPAGGVHLPGWL